MSEQVIKKLISELEELNLTGAIGYSIYKNLMSKVRLLQI